MASPLAGVSHGYSITFPVSGFTAEFKDVTLPPTAVESIETTHQGSDDGLGHTPITADSVFLPSLVRQTGEASLEIHFNPDKQPETFVGVVETAMVVTHPSLATWTFGGFIKEYTPGGHDHNGLMMGTLVVVRSGATTYAAG